MFREMDDNGDIKAGTFVYKQESVACNVATQIQLWSRENPLDLTEGIPWNVELPKINKGRLTAQIRDIAFSCSHVTAVSKSISFSEPDENRQVKIEFTIRTEYGDEQVESYIHATNN